MKTFYVYLICHCLYSSAIAQGASHSNMDNLLLNQIQVIGSHNSYKEAIDSLLFQELKQTDSALVMHLDYSHVSLSEQLSMGLRNLEIDVYADTSGGKYAHPKGMEMMDQNDAVKHYDPEGLMTESGFKVLHVPDIDFRSNCLTFKKCLRELKSWSEANADHYPVFVTINAKDRFIDKPGFTEPEKFTSNIFDLLDKEILDVMDSKMLIVPDEIRGNYNSLESAVLQGNWPKLSSTKGKFIFILDETGIKQNAYVQGHASLRGRVMFVDAEPGNPEAAILIMNDPLRRFNEIRDRVKEGYIVRTRADANTKEARENDYSRFKAACGSGAQIITTDYYLPTTHFDSGYKIRFEGGTFLRINPIMMQKE